MSYFKACLVDTACFSCSHCKLFTETDHTTVLRRVGKRSCTFSVTIAFLCTAAWGSRHLAQICLHTLGPCDVWGIFFSIATWVRTKSQHHFMKAWEHPIKFLSGPNAFSNWHKYKHQRHLGFLYRVWNNPVSIAHIILFKLFCLCLFMSTRTPTQVMYHSSE